MTATNHVVTGMTLLAAVPHPAMLPVAFLSHFALDALPHYGAPATEHTSHKFLVILFSDMGVAASFLLAITLLQPENWPLLVLGGILSASPDLMWLPRWLQELQGKDPGKLHLIGRFHSWIQWAEKPWGLIVELIWFLGFSYLLFTLA